MDSGNIFAIYRFKWQILITEKKNQKKVSKSNYEE